MGSCHTERLHVTKLLLPLELISIDWSCNAVCAHVDSPTVGQKASTFELMKRGYDRRLHFGISRVLIN